MPFFIFFIGLLIFIIVAAISSAIRDTSSQTTRSRSTNRQFYSQHPKSAREIGVEGEVKVRKITSDTNYGPNNSRHFNNYIVKDEQGKSHEIDHIEIRSNGIFCIETKNYQGILTGSAHSPSWTQHIGNKHYTHYNPLKQNEGHIKQLHRILGNDYKIVSIIVMANNNANSLNIKNVINLSQLSVFLLRYNDGTRYTPMQMQEIYQKLVNARSNITIEQHVQSLSRTVTHTTPTVPPPTAGRVCPRCQSPLTIQYGALGRYECCTHHPQCEYTRHF